MIRKPTASSGRHKRKTIPKDMTFSGLFLLHPNCCRSSYLPTIKILVKCGILYCAAAFILTDILILTMKKPMKKVLDEPGILLLEEEFHCRGSFGPMHKGKPDEADLKAVREFAVRLIENK